MEKITEKLKEKLAEVIGNEDVKNATDETNFIEEYNLSSLQLVKYFVTIEEYFSFEFDIEELSEDKFKSFLDLEKNIKLHKGIE